MTERTSRTRSGRILDSLAIQIVIALLGLACWALIGAMLSVLILAIFFSQ